MMHGNFCVVDGQVPPHYDDNKVNTKSESVCLTKRIVETLSGTSSLFAEYISTQRQRRQRFSRKTLRYQKISTTTKVVIKVKTLNGCFHE